MMRSLDVAVEDLTPSSSQRSRPIRWISFTFVRLLDFEFEQGHHIPLFRPLFCSRSPLFIFFLFLFFYCLANIMLCNKLDEVRSHGNRKGISPSLVHLFIVFTDLFLIMKNE